MTMDLNAEVLIVARESRGRTQKDIADAAHVTQGLISKVEHGLVPLTQDQLDLIAEYLNYPVELFYESGRIREVGSPCLYHRKRKTLPAKVLRQLDARMYMRNLNIRKLFNDLDIDSERMFHALDPDEYNGSAVEVARTLRAAWRIPEGPIENLTALIESAGGVVIMTDFGTRKLFGMSCWTKGGHPLFFVNSGMPTEELRWSLAHELGHLTMHATPCDGDPEQQADEFAGEFLAPEHLMRTHLRRIDFSRLANIKMYWRISMKAVIKRGQVLKAIDPDTATKLYKQYSARRYNTAEPYALSPEPPTIVTQAIQVHMQEHGYSREELARALRLNVDEFTQEFCSDAAPRADGNVVSLFANDAQRSNE